MTPGSILLVEDNADDVDLTLHAFNEHGWRDAVVVVRNGTEALDYLFSAGSQDSHPLPQVVLLDLKLPKIDGLEVLRRIRASERTRLLPVVVLSSSQEERDILRSYDLGANSFVRKPVDFVEFVDAVRQLGVYWLVLNRQVPNRDYGGVR